MSISLDVERKRLIQHHSPKEVRDLNGNFARRSRLAPDAETRVQCAIVSGCHAVETIDEQFHPKRVASVCRSLIPFFHLQVVEQNPCFGI